MLAHLLVTFPLSWRCSILQSIKSQNSVGSAPRTPNADMKGAAWTGVGRLLRVVVSVMGELRSWRLSIARRRAFLPVSTVTRVTLLTAASV